MTILCVFCINSHIFIYIGKSETDVGIALRCVRLGLGRHKMPGPRAVAFAKRLSTTALQLEHHDSIAILVELKQILRVSNKCFLFCFK
jgi:hypothetical protein